MIKESEDVSPRMIVGDIEMGGVTPVDISRYSPTMGDHDWHQIFLVDDPRFMNKIILIPGMLTFGKVSQGEKELLKWHNQPEALSGSTSDWRLMDIDEMEDFYDFYASGGMGGYDGLLEKAGALDYGTSDLEDVDHPNRSRIYSVNFKSGKRRSSYRHEEKLIIGIREISDEDIFNLVKHVFENVPLTQSIVIIERVKKMYPNINIESIAGENGGALKGANILRNLGFN